MSKFHDDMAARARVPNHQMAKELLGAAKGMTPKGISLEIKLNEEGPLPDTPGPTAARIPGGPNLV